MLSNPETQRAVARFSKDFDDFAFFLQIGHHTRWYSMANSYPSFVHEVCKLYQHYQLHTWILTWWEITQDKRRRKHMDRGGWMAVSGCRLALCCWWASRVCHEIFRGLDSCHRYSPGWFGIWLYWIFESSKCFNVNLLMIEFIIECLHFVH